MASALVSSRLDYCNSTLYRTWSSNLNILQHVQNALARTVMMMKRHEHITHVLAKLHWPPITARIQFKTALLTFNTLTTHQPSYFLDLLQPYTGRHGNWGLPITTYWTFLRQELIFPSTDSHTFTYSRNVTSRTFKNRLDFSTVTVIHRLSSAPCSCDSYFLMTDAWCFKSSILLLLLLLL